MEFIKEEYISLKNITKKYDSSIVVDNLNLDISNGEIYGLVGRNGAGKTTTIKMLVGLIKPTTGTINIMEKDITTCFNNIKQYIGYVSNENCMYEYLTGGEYLEFIAKLKGESVDINANINFFSDYLEFKDKLNDLIMTYSSGTKQKLMIASQLMNYKKIKILVLDEPMNKLDPVISKKVKTLIHDIVEETKMSVFISAHQLDIIQSMCSKIGILEKGTLLFNGTVNSLMNKFNLQHTLEDIVIDIIQNGIVV